MSENTVSTIRQLHEAAKWFSRTWRSRPGGYEELQAAWTAYRERGEALRQMLPVPTAVAYAYSPRENTGSGGSDHILVKERLVAGRLVREEGKTLCQSSHAYFWGLTEMPGREANCLRCLECAERLSARKAPKRQ
jgi:hypothetical protein